MIEIELFVREEEDNNQCIKIWIENSLVYANERLKPEDLVALRDNVHNELLWLNDYIREQGLEKHETQKNDADSADALEKS
jgi:hypothetical protein